MIFASASDFNRACRCSSVSKLGMSFQALRGSSSGRTEVEVLGFIMVVMVVKEQRGSAVEVLN